MSTPRPEDISLTITKFLSDVTRNRKNAAFSHTAFSCGVKVENHFEYIGQQQKKIVTQISALLMESFFLFYLPTAEPLYEKSGAPLKLRSTCIIRVIRT